MPHGSTLTYPILGLSVFARQLCLPVPAMLFLITAGTLARESLLNMPLVLAISVAACLAGDFIWFEAGRHWGSHILRVFTGFSDNPRKTTERARLVFARFGLRSLLIAKFIPGLDGISPPMAGLEGIRRSHFFVFDGIGSLIWSAFYVLLGMFFAGQVNQILNVFEGFGLVALWGIGVPFTAFVGWRAINVLQALRRLKTRKISPALLNVRLQSDGDSVVVIDLLNFQVEGVPAFGIPGAVRIDPKRLKNSSLIASRPGLSFVLYCSTSSQFRSARVAMRLARRGIHEVWVLDGGLNTWVEEGFPVSMELLNEDQAMAKFGLRILEDSSTTPGTAAVSMPVPEGDM